MELSRVEGGQLVSVADVSALQFDWELLLRKGFAAMAEKEQSTKELYSAEYLIESVRAGNLLLFLLTAGETGQVIGFFTIEIKVYPKAMALEVPFAYMEPGYLLGRELRTELFEHVVKIAKLNRCKWIIGYGREGWTRAVKSNKPWIMTNKFLNQVESDESLH